MLESNVDLRLALAVCADPDKELMLESKVDFKFTLAVCADPLNVFTIPSAYNFTDAEVAFISVSVAKVSSREAVKLSNESNLPSCTDCSEVIELSKATLCA